MVHPSVEKVNPHTEHPWSPFQRQGEVIVAILGIGLFALFATLPDMGDDVFTVALRNDTAHVAIFKQCGDTCRSFYDIERVRPGESVPANTTDNVANWWKVTDEAGNILGCWSLLYAHSTRGLSVSVSEAGPCPKGGLNDDVSLVATIPWWLLTLVIVGVLLGNVAVAIVGANRLMTHRGIRGNAEAILMLPLTIIIVFGGWLIYDLFVLLCEGFRLLRWAAPAT